MPLDIIWAEIGYIASVHRQFVWGVFITPQTIFVILILNNENLHCDCMQLFILLVGSM